MKIGIITSGNDNLSIFKFLSQHDHEYFIYYDNLSWPYWDKPIQHNIQKIIDWIDFLSSNWVDKIIIPPIYELQLLSSNNKILPLFQSYLQNFIFKYSLVGKLWIWWDFADIQSAQELITQEATKYQPTTNQTGISKFNYPFKYRTKEIWLRKYYITNLSYSDPMINKIIKNDLRYFKDADIDTRIPLNYWYFNYQNTIFKFFNFKKTRFHKIDKLEQCFTLQNLKTSKEYKTTIFYTWQIEFFKKQKRLSRLISRWDIKQIKYIQI